MPKFNKMFVMLPVMLMARKLDGEDPTTIHWARVAYGVVQTICVLIVSLTYLKACQIKDNTVVYVPPPAMPFGTEADAKKKYTQTTYGAHVISGARSLLASTIFGIIFTCGLHYYKGMVMGLAIQTIMGPFNLAENPIIAALLTGNGFRQEDKIFEEKTAAELTDQDEVVDGEGNPIARNSAGAIKAGKGSSATTKSLEDILLDTWDKGSKANLSDLMKALNKKNCNYQTKEDNWSPIMILAGLGAPGTGAAISQVLELGCKMSVQDKEGWNALHWSAFHGSVESAKVLSKEKPELLSVKDKEGYTPIDMARKENNNDVAKVFEDALGETKKDK